MAIKEDSGKYTGHKKIYIKKPKGILKEEERSSAVGLNEERTETFHTGPRTDDNYLKRELLE